MIKKYEFDDLDLDLLNKCQKGIEYEDNGDPIRDVLEHEDFVAAIRLLLELAKFHGVKPVADDD